MRSASRAVSYSAPALLAAASVLAAYADTAGHWTTLLRPLGIAIVIAISVTLLAAGMTRRPQATAICSSIAILILTGRTIAWALAFGLVLWLLGAWVLRLRGRLIGFPTGPFTAFSALLVAVSVFNAFGALVPSDLVASARGAAGVAPTRPNIYVLLLDGYPRADTLRDEFGYDNSPFAAGLTARGFAYYSDAVSPAARTELTLLSMLGTEVGEDATPAWAPSIANRRQVRDALQRAPATARLREAGYHLVHIASPIAHTNFVGWDEQIDTGQITEFEIALLDHSPLAAFVGDWLLEQHRARIVASLERLAQLATLERQQLVLAHVMAPHPPFVYGGGPGCYVTRQCSLYEVRPGWIRMSTEQYAVALSAQLDAVNSLVLSALDQMVAVDPGATIVVLSDHGARHDEGQPEEWRRSLLAIRGSDALNGEHSVRNLFLRLLDSP